MSEIINEVEEEEEYDWICKDCGMVGGYNEDHAEETDEIGFTDFWCVGCYGKKEKLPNAQPYHEQEAFSK